VSTKLAPPRMMRTMPKRTVIFAIKSCFLREA
jgi:hypothetical protein